MNLILSKIRNSIKTINYSAFANCENLSSILILNSVETISEKVFQNCSNLTSIIILYSPNKQPNKPTKLKYQQKFINAGIKNKITFIWKQYTK